MGLKRVGHDLATEQQQYGTSTSNYLCKSQLTALTSLPHVFPGEICISILTFGKADQI